MGSAASERQRSFRKPYCRYKSAILLSWQSSLFESSKNFQMPPTTRSATRKTTYPAQKNKLCFPVIRKVCQSRRLCAQIAVLIFRKANSSGHKTDATATSSALKKRAKKASIPQKNKLDVPILPEVSRVASGVIRDALLTRFNFLRCLFQQSGVGQCHSLANM